MLNVRVDQNAQCKQNIKRRFFINFYDYLIAPCILVKFSNILWKSYSN